MNASWVDRDTIEAPATALDETTGAIGDGMDLIREGDPRFTEWASWLESIGSPRPADDRQ